MQRPPVVTLPMVLLVSIEPWTVSAASGAIDNIGRTLDDIGMPMVSFGSTPKTMNSLKHKSAAGTMNAYIAPAKWNQWWHHLSYPSRAALYSHVTHPNTVLYIVAALESRWVANTMLKYLLKS